MPKCHRPCKEKSKGSATLAYSSSQLLGGTESTSKSETLRGAFDQISILCVDTGINYSQIKGRSWGFDA
jgi:hypothetical protein